MRIDDQVAMEIAAHEALVPQAYRDSRGVWTWSIGITSASGHRVERYIGRPQPLAHCLAVFVWALRRYADEVMAAFAGHPLSKAQFAAALSFHWNTGAIGRAAWVRHVRAGDQAAARRAFLAWRKPPEILARRRRECALFFDGRWSGDGRMLVYPVTARHRPDWRAGRRLDVSQALRAALAAGQGGTEVEPPGIASPPASAKPAAAGLPQSSDHAPPKKIPSDDKPGLARPAPAQEIDMAVPLAILAPILAEVGAPLLKRLVAESGGAGAAAAKVLEAIAGRAGVAPTAEAVAAAFGRDPAGTAEAIRAVEIERREDWAALIAEINASMRAEATAPALLQRSWRPIFGLVYGAAFLALALALVRALWLGDVVALNAAAGISGLLIAFYGMGASVLGVYVWQRSAEKRAGAA